MLGTRQTERRIESISTMNGRHDGIRSQKEPKIADVMWELRMSFSQVQSRLCSGTGSQLLQKDGQHVGDGPTPKPTPCKSIPKPNRTIAHGA